MSSLHVSRHVIGKAKRVVVRGLLTAVWWVLASALAHANLLINGGFEDPAFVDNPLHYIHLTGTELTGWTSFSTYKGTVLFNDLYNPVSQGLQAVQIEVPGDWISQTFTTVAGASYALSFDMMAYTGYGGPGLGRAPCPCISLLYVSVGSASAIFGGNSAGYVRETLFFTATASTTTLTFMNPSVPAALGNYPEIDNVSVVQTSPPVPVAEQLDALLSTVTGVGPGQSLAAKVAQAQSYYAVPDVPDTCAVLSAFVNEVSAQEGKKIPQVLAKQITVDAQAIMTTIGCQN